MTYYVLKDTMKGTKVLFATDDKKDLAKKAKCLKKSGYVVIAKSAGNIYDGNMRLYNMATSFRVATRKLKKVL